MPTVLERSAALSFLLLAAALPWSIAPMSIAVGLCGALTLAIWWSPGGERWVRTPVDLPALVWLLALAVATFAGDDPSGSARRITKGLLLAIVPLAAYHARDPRLARRAVGVLLVSAAAATIYALVKFAAQGGVFPARVRGLVGHPLTYGGQAMLLTLVAAALLLRPNGARWRLAGAALLTLVLPALLGSYTRSAWIGSFAGVAVLIASTRARWLPALAGAAVALVLLMPQGYRERAASAFDMRNHWNTERIVLWEAGWRIFREHPLVGVGLQDLKPYVARYRSPGVHEPPHGHMHNVWIQVAVTMGVMGVAAFAFLWLGLARTAAWRWRADRGDPDADPFGLTLRLMAIAGLTGFFLAGLFEWNFGDEELIDFLFTLVGMAFAASGWNRTWDGERRSS